MGMKNLKPLTNIINSNKVCFEQFTLKAGSCGLVVNAKDL
jgi:hypothetical protein